MVMSESDVQLWHDQRAEIEKFKSMTTDRISDSADCGAESA